MKKSTIIISNILSILIMGGIGFYLGRYFSYIENKFQIILLILVLGLSFIAGIIIHEFGHYFFGRLTGYKFSMFRVFSYTLIKENDKIVLKKLNIPGTLGQCLMLPPNVTNKNKIPFFWYNLGGA